MRGVARVGAFGLGPDRATARLGDTLRKAQLYERIDLEAHPFE
jgi:hypothetical protein